MGRQRGASVVDYAPALDDNKALAAPVWRSLSWFLDPRAPFLSPEVLGGMCGVFVGILCWVVTCRHGAWEVSSQRGSSKLRIIADRGKPAGLTLWKVVDVTSERKRVVTRWWSLSTEGLFRIVIAHLLSW